MTLVKFLLKNKYLILLLILTFISLFSLLGRGLIPTHDGEYHLIRFYEFDKVLREGFFYPRWAPDLDFGYGLPLFTFVYPLPNYFTSFLHLFNISFLDSVKLNMFFASLTGAVLFYFWTKKYWGELGGLVSSIFYTYTPYHFVDIYVRGSVGEVWALALFPGIFISFDKFLESRKIYFLIVSSVFLTLTIFSHNIVGLMCFSFGVIYILFKIFNSKLKLQLILNSLFLILLSLGLSAIFWLPALLETKYVVGLQLFNIKQNFPDLFQLIFPSWGTGFFDSNLDNQMSVQIGIANLLAFVVSLTVLVKLWNKNNEISKNLLFFIFSFILLIFLMLPVSLPFWEKIPLIHYFQFPWRFLSLIMIVAPFLAGSIVLLTYKKITSLVLIFLAVLITFSYTKPAYYMIRSDKYYITRSNFIDSTNSPGDSFNTIWGQKKNSRPTQIFIAEFPLSIDNLKVKGLEINANLSTKTSQKIIISRNYFPNWTLFLDNKKISIFSTNGLIAFNFPKGQHSFLLRFENTFIENIADLISLTSLLILLFFLLRKKVF